MKKIFKCSVCGKYTLSKKHCSSNSVSAHPPIFNPNDSYGKYRRMQKGLED